MRKMEDWNDIFKEIAEMLIRLAKQMDISVEEVIEGTKKMD